MPPNGEPVYIDVDKRFKYVFWADVGFTFFFFLAYLFLCFQGDPNVVQTNFTTMLQELIPLGFGSMVGLLGGKAI